MPESEKAEFVEKQKHHGQAIQRAEVLCNKARIEAQQAHSGKNRSSIESSKVKYEAALKALASAKIASRRWPLRGSVWTHADFWDWLNADVVTTKRRRGGNNG